MPRTKSAERAARVAEIKRVINRSRRTATKTSITKVEKLIADNKLESAQQAIIAAVSSLDKAANKRVIHRNTAARRKSRLVKELNKAVLLKTSESKSKKKAK